MAGVRDLCDVFIGVPMPEHDLVRRLRQEVAALPSRRPILVEQVRSSGLPAAVAAAVREHRPDVVHLEPGWAADLAAAADPVRTVLATLDAWHLNWAAEARQAPGRGRRLRMAREAARMRRFESRAYAASDAVVVVSERDAAVLHDLDPRVTPVVVTNGVDTAYWTSDGRPRDPGVVLFTGAMGYAPNVDAAVFAATEVLPRLRRKDVRLVLAGRDPAPAVLALAGPRVEVTGTLPDLRPLLWSAGAYICPMRTGTGVKNKLLEALAAGCPSVATPLACGGLGLTDGTDVLVGTDAAALTAALDRVLGDPALAARLGAAAVVRAAGLSWAATAEGYEAVYSSNKESPTTT